MKRGGGVKKGGAHRSDAPGLLHQRVNAAVSICTRVNLGPGSFRPPVGPISGRGPSHAVAVGG